MSKAKNTSILNEISERTEKARENVPKYLIQGSCRQRSKELSNYLCIRFMTSKYWNFQGN